MQKAKPWSEVRFNRSKATPEQRDEVDAAAGADSKRALMTLHQLRRARALSQAQLAEQLGMNQGAVSRVERQSDLYLSTLQRFVHAMGGRLTISAEFEHEEPIELEFISDLQVVNSKPTKKAKPHGGIGKHRKVAK